MSIEFKFKINKEKNIKLNIKQFNLSVLKLKVKGIDSNKNKFSAHITIKFNNVSNKIVVKKIIISQLEIENSSEENSYVQYRNIYTHNILSSSSSSSSSSSCKNNKVYNQIYLFAKNIKLFTQNDKVDYMIFSLKNTNIKKMKIRGKIN